MKSIRKISVYDRQVQDRYYITDSGTVYSEAKDRKVMRDGDRRTVTVHLVKEAMSVNKEWFVPFKDWGMFCIILRDGTVLRRLTTSISDDTKTAKVHLLDTTGKEITRIVARLVANTFIESVDGKEVHHIDQDRTNNSVENLEVLTFEEHRGVGSHAVRHQL